MHTLKVQRAIGFGIHRTAYYLCMRVRASLVDPEFRELMGIVEFDQTYIAGKNKNRHAANKLRGGGVANKLAVIGAVSRNDTLVACEVARVNADTAKTLIPQADSEKIDLVATDDTPISLRLNKLGIRYDSLSHLRDAFVRGVVHTQTIDGFRSLLKTQHFRDFHSVSAKYLPLYVAETKFL